MIPHEPERHEPILARLLTSEDPAGSFARSELTGCGTCRELVEAHVDLGNRLDRVGAEERAAIARALEAPPEPLGPAEEALLRAIGADEAAARPHALPRRRLLPWVFVAAAAAVLLSFLLHREPDPGADDGLVLGHGLELIAPQGTVDDFDLFRWSYEGLGEGWYEVEVRPVGAAPGSEPFVSGPLRSAEWRPPPEMRARWGNEIRYVVTVHAGTGGSDPIEQQPGHAVRR